MSERVTRYTVLRRLDNWGRAYRDPKYAKRMRCGSIEGRYLPEKVHDGDQMKGGGAAGYDADEAQDTEAAIVACEFTKLQRLLVVAIFANRTNHRKVCRLLGLHWDSLGAGVEHCVSKIHASLESPTWRKRPSRARGTLQLLGVRVALVPIT